MNWTASVVIHRNKAYVPMNARMESGVYLLEEPIIAADLTVDDLNDALQRIRELGNPVVHTPDIKTRRDPLLLATRARSWKQLAREGAAYGFDWTDKEVRLDMSKVDRQGRFVDDPDKTRRFPPDVPMREIAEAILQDWHSRSLPRTSDGHSE